LTKLRRLADFGLLGNSSRDFSRDFSLGAMRSLLPGIRLPGIRLHHTRAGLARDVLPLASGLAGRCNLRG
jgi:hypothetical protein